MKPNRSFFYLIAEIAWYCFIFTIGCWLIGTTHYNASIDSWYYNDMLAGIGMAHDLFVAHHSLFLWQLKTTSWLLELIPLYFATLISHNPHIWEILLDCFELIWLMLLLILTAVTIDNKQSTRLIMGLSALVIFFFLAHFGPGNFILMPFLITTFFSIPAFLMPLSALLISFSELKKSHQVKQFFIGLICLVTTMTNPLFLVNFAAPFLMLLAGKKSRLSFPRGNDQQPLFHHSNDNHLFWLILMTCLIGFGISHAIHFFMPQFIIKTPWTLNSPDTVLHYLYNITTSLPKWWFAIICSLAACVYCMIYPSKNQPFQALVFFMVYVALFALIGMFLDHDLHRLVIGKYFSAQNHYLMLTIAPIFIILPLMICRLNILSPFMAIMLTLLLIASQFSILLAPWNFKAIFTKKPYITCLEKLIKKHHLHDGLTAYNEMRILRVESNWHLNLATVRLKNLKPTSILNTHWQYLGKHFDYVIVKSGTNHTEGIEPFDLTQKFVKKFGHPDAIASCPMSTIFIYRRGQLDNYTTHP